MKIWSTEICHPPSELFINHPESSSLSHALVYSGRKLLGFTVGKIGIGGWEERWGKCMSRIVVEREERFWEDILCSAMSLRRWEWFQRRVRIVSEKGVNGFRDG